MADKFYGQELLHTPGGVRDIYGAECASRLKVQGGIHQVLHSYGFHDIQTPTFEYFDIFSKERGTVQSKAMFKFFDRGNNTLVLRPDITPAIARCVAKYDSSGKERLTDRKQKEPEAARVNIPPRTSPSILILPLGPYLPKYP